MPHIQHVSEVVKHVEASVPEVNKDVKCVPKDFVAHRLLPKIQTVETVVDMPQIQHVHEAVTHEELGSVHACDLIKQVQSADLCVASAHAACLQTYWASAAMMARTAPSIYTGASIAGDGSYRSLY
eukprot:gnl/TRDRNA2_/TRDRNA2_172521_c2_seq1.p1 gnl/TRDRNA2_/TRDRNA2_172521_c2~~gnl/TRDRNA2_/TRDRNA2_172521_c2_seq1.p1  ORF type:complete len:126 (-),score=20.91 gnl/TRDRNA2_/TRDRNA2_172521_c2_seq1:129-506(-)